MRIIVLLFVLLLATIGVAFAMGPSRESLAVEFTKILRAAKDVTSDSSTAQQPDDSCLQRPGSG